MADTAAYLVDQRLPEVPYRHHVLTVPWILRYRLAVDRPLLGRVLGTSLRTLFAWQRRRGRARGIRDGHTGSVTFIQRFGGALNLHPHVHALVPDGLFVPSRAASTHTDGASLTFVPLPPPTPEEIEALTERVARRVTARIVRLVEEEETIGGRLEETAASLQTALRRALELPAPADQLTWTDPANDHLTARPELCAKIAGFSLHAAQAVAADDRDGLERLCRYGLRPPFAEDRLHLEASGEVVYALSRPWPNASGVTHLVMSPMDFLARLAALIPLPGTHLIRYHGVFANRSRWRSRLPLPRPREGTTSAERSPPTNAATDRHAGSRRRRLAWAELLARVFLIDVLRCPHCGERRRILSFLTEPGTVRRILAHLEIPTTPPPLAPAALPLAPEGQWYVDVAGAEDERAWDGEPGADPDDDVDARAPP